MLPWQRISCMWVHVGLKRNQVCFISFRVLKFKSNSRNSKNCELLENEQNHSRYALWLNESLSWSQISMLLKKVFRNCMFSTYRKYIFYKISDPRPTAKHWFLERISKTSHQRATTIDTIGRSKHGRLQSPLLPWIWSHCFSMRWKAFFSLPPIP